MKAKKNINLHPPSPSTVKKLKKNKNQLTPFPPSHNEFVKRNNPR